MGTGSSIGAASDRLGWISGFATVATIGAATTGGALTDGGWGAACGMPIVARAAAGAGRCAATMRPPR